MGGTSDEEVAAAAADVAAAVETAPVDVVTAEVAAVEAAAVDVVAAVEAAVAAVLEAAALGRGCAATEAGGRFSLARRSSNRWRVKSSRRSRASNLWATASPLSAMAARSRR